jgi:hypothetical protein
LIFWRSPPLWVPKVKTCLYSYIRLKKAESSISFCSGYWAEVNPAWNSWRHAWSLFFDDCFHRARRKEPNWRDRMKDLSKRINEIFFTKLDGIGVNCQRIDTCMLPYHVGFAPIAWKLFGQSISRIIDTSLNSCCFWRCGAGWMVSTDRSLWGTSGRRSPKFYVLFVKANPIHRSFLPVDRPDAESLRLIWQV